MARAPGTSGFQGSGSRPGSQVTAEPADGGRGGGLTVSPPGMTGHWADASEIARHGEGEWDAGAGTVGGSPGPRERGLQPRVLLGASPGREVHRARPQLRPQTVLAANGWGGEWGGGHGNVGTGGVEQAPAGGLPAANLQKGSPGFLVWRERQR